MATTHVPEDFHALYDQGFRRARGIEPAPPVQENAGHSRMAADIPDLKVEYDEATQLPKLITTQQPVSRLSTRSSSSPEDAATQFVEERADLWELSQGDLSTIEVVSVSRSGLNTVNLVQRVEGKEVFNSDVTMGVSADNAVISVAGQFFPGTAAQAARSRALAAPTTPEEEAIAKAVSDLTGAPYAAPDFSPTAAPDESGPYRFYTFKAKRKETRPTFDRPIRLKDVMFPLGEGEFVPGYYMEIWLRDYPAFAYVMDAVDTPDLLYRKNLTSSAAFTYRVYNTGDSLFRPEDGPAPGTPHPTGVPDGFQASVIESKLIKLESLLPGAPWLPPNARRTIGNNCIAYADLQPPQGRSRGDVVGRVTSKGRFNHQYDHAQPASTPKNLQCGIVGMFFHVNWLHDRWYEAGFDEASGNAQQNNFGRGGLGGDPILAEANDFSGFDNANMSTPADGASPRMQMFEFRGPAPLPTRTSSLEALITFHEMGHYITNRLVGNGNGLTNQQGGAMGEGWGDFFAICMTSQSTDDFARGAFAAGGWTDLTRNFKENYYFSIRRYPYSADMNKNPLTFKHISNNVVLPEGPPRSSNGGSNSEVHNAGEVWCTVLWEVFVNLVAKHQHEEAERRMLSYVIGGLKLTPIRPTFTQARDGIITATAALDPADLPEVWAGFAKRGMGDGAVSPPASSTSLAGVIESFSVP